MIEKPISMDVLSSEFTLLESCFLEASAGTGKTFAIEQLIARLLLEGNFQVEEILAVTFTRAAARDIRNRVRANLEKINQGWVPPYLHILYEKGKRIEIEERLREALLYFDEAQIFTIHGFCHRMLAEFAFEGCIAFEREDSQAKKYMRDIVCEFLRTNLKVEEAELLLKESRQQFDLLVERIVHAIEQPKQASFLVQKIAEECRILWIEKRKVEEALTPDALLEKMEEALKRPAFLEKVREKYRVLIVDEFQDTDPLSWKIFEEIFLDNRRSLVYLVGDPKQSIYGFRRADIYTYLQARKKIKKCACLRTNYRSRPVLVEALNSLFSSSNWIDLPGAPGALSYIPIVAGRSDLGLHEESPLHFFLGKGTSGREKMWPTKQLEREELFPFIANELIRLHTFRKVPFKEMAILVKDRFQALRLSDFLQRHHIPFSVRQTLNLSETKGFTAVEELLKAALHPEDRSARQKVLWKSLLKKRVSFFELHHILLHQGLPIFYEKLVKEGLLEEQSLRQTMEILLETACPPQQLLQKIRELRKIDPEEEPRLKIRSSGEEDKVAILTLFASKGLEFTIVFALGMASRQLIEEEAEAETMRQLYVAMTRAREKLYVPLLFHRSSSSRSPIEIFWQKRFQRELLGEEALQPLKEEKITASFSWVGKEEVPLFIKEFSEEVIVHVEKPLPEFPRTYLTSFSSLSKSIIPAAEKEEKVFSGIPLGPETGKLIHAILEKLFCEGWHRYPNLPVFKNVIKDIVEHTILHSHQDAVEEMIVKALQIPLWEGFCLKALAPSQLRTELEFLFPEGNFLVKGFIDLFFCHQERWYILDWKTNWIESSLQSCMEKQQYFLQAALYKEAMQRYVKLIDKRKALTFGGVIYLFLRGPSVYYVQDEEMAFSLATR